MRVWKCKHWWKLMRILWPEKINAENTNPPGTTWLKRAFVASDKFNYTLKYTETYAYRPHIDSVCYCWACYLAPLVWGGRFEAGQPFVSCNYQHSQTQCCKEAQTHCSKYNDLPYCVQLGSVTSAFSPHSSQEKSHWSLRGKFQALHEGIIDTPPASPQQTDSHMQGWVE